MSVERNHHRRDLERLHEGMVVELDRRFARRGDLPETGFKGKGGDPSVDAEVASTISTVRQISSVLTELQEANRRQEELIYDQRRVIADLDHERQTVLEKAADAERCKRAERDRADRAETLLKTSEAQVRKLEEYCVSLKSHLNSLVAVVRESLPGEDKVIGGEARAP